MDLSKPDTRNYQYFPFIDGLRALAVLSVIIYHLHSSWLPGGFVGVDVFFVISGFVVSASINNFKGNGFWSFLAFFYARRIRRIYPALVICLLVTGYISALFIPGSWLSDVNQRTGLYAFWGFSNFILAANGRDYFAPTTEFNPYTHTWSLGVEEQFYLIFPLLFCAWLYGKKGKKYSIILFSLGLIASVIFSAWQSKYQPTNAYFLSPGRFWELASGVILYQVVTLFPGNRLSNQKRFSSAVGVISFIGLILSFVFSTPNNFPMPGAILAAISTLGVIFSLYKQECLPGLKSFLTQRYILLIGKMSYSLYLWHWPTFVLFRWTCGLDSFSTRLAAIVITVLLASMSYYLVEKPMKKYKGLSRFSNIAIVSIGLCIIVFSTWGAKLLNERSETISLSNVSKNAELWYPDRGPATAEYPGCLAQFRAVEDEGATVLVLKPEGCQQERPFKHGVLHVIGDSHALAYQALFRQFAIRNNLEVDAYPIGCPFISFQAERDIDDAGCMQITEASLRALHKRANPGDVIFLASLRLPRFVDQWIYFGSAGHKQSFFSSEAQNNREREVNYAIDKLSDFTSQGIHVVFEAPKPIFQVPPYRCSDWFNKKNPICSHGMEMDRDLLQTYRAPVLDSYGQIIKVLPGISIWDPFDILCPGSVCSVWNEGHSMFFDGDHISAYGSMKLLPDFTAFMLPKLSEPATKTIVYSYEFNKEKTPDFLKNVSGLSSFEDWGRWSDSNVSPAVILDFAKPFPKGFTLEISAHAYGPNIGKPIKIILGNEQQSIILGQMPTISRLHFSNNDGANNIEIIPPSPISPKALGQSGDIRSLGIGLQYVKFIEDQD